MPKTTKGITTVLSAPPRWRNRFIHSGVLQPALMPLPLVGMSPTWEQRTQTFSAQVYQPCTIERLLVSKVGTGRLMGQLFIGSELASGEASSFDAELVGSPTSFGVKLTDSLAITPGVKVHLMLTWSPGPWRCLMTIEEWARRTQKGSWGAKVQYGDKRYSLRIQGEKPPVELVDDETYRQVKRNRLGIVPGFQPFCEVTAMFLCRVVR